MTCRRVLKIDVDVQGATGPLLYRLVANISHQGSAKGGAYKIAVHHQAQEKWHQIQDLFVEDILPPMVILSESYIQIWELQS